MSWSDDKIYYNVQKLVSGNWQGVHTTHSLEDANAFIRKNTADSERGIPGVDVLPQYRIVQKTTNFTIISGDKN